MPFDLLPNSAFSTKLPTLQIAWDSSSLSALKECPRKYYYSIVLGWVPRYESVHLTFGTLYHGALERYDHAKCAGQDHEFATRSAVRWALEATWNKTLKRPWYSDDQNKNRLTLLRSIVWYLEQFADDPIETVILANGKPAVELSFRMELGFPSPEGSPYLLCGHLDRVGIFQDHTYIIDRKSTKSTLSEDYFSKYSPDNQFSCYTLAGQIVYNLPIHGLIVDAAQIAVTFSRFRRGLVSRTPPQLEEFYRDLQWWIAAAERYAEAEYWPQNDKSCNNYGGCPYRTICAMSPSVRDQWIPREFVRRTWDPLKVRGDI